MSFSKDLFKILLEMGIEKPCHKQFIAVIMLCILKDPKRELIKFLDAVVLFRLGAVKELSHRAGEQLRLKALLEMS